MCPVIGLSYAPGGAYYLDDVWEKIMETPDEQETHGKVEKRSITIEMNKKEGKTRS